MTFPSLTAAIRNLSSILSSPRDTVIDDDMESTGGTNKSLIVYLNAKTRLDFHNPGGLLFHIWKPHCIVQ